MNLLLTEIMGLLSIYVCAAPDYDKSSWIAVKETMGLPFPNVSKL